MTVTMRRVAQPLCIQFNEAAIFGYHGGGSLHFDCNIRYLDIQ